MDRNTEALLRQELLNYAGPILGSVYCDICGKRHEAVFTHISQFGPNGGDLCFAVVCTTKDDGLTDWYTQEVVDLTEQSQAQLSALVAAITD